MKRIIIILFLLFCSTSWICPTRTFNPDYDLYSAPNFNQRYEVINYGPEVWFVIIHNKTTGRYAFGRDEYPKDGTCKHVLHQRTEFDFTDIGLYKPYGIIRAENTPWFLFPVQKDGKWGFVDIGISGWNPAMRIPCMYDDIENTPFVHDAYAEVKKGDRWIVIDYYNNEIKL